jgi:hypothetical protein
MPLVVCIVGRDGGMVKRLLGERAGLKSQFPNPKGELQRALHFFTKVYTFEEFISEC